MNVPSTSGFEWLKTGLPLRVALALWSPPGHATPQVGGAGSALEAVLPAVSFPSVTRVNDIDLELEEEPWCGWVESALANLPLGSPLSMSPLSSLLSTTAKSHFQDSLWKGPKKIEPAVLGKLYSLEEGEMVVWGAWASEKPSKPLGLKDGGLMRNDETGLCWAVGGCVWREEGVLKNHAMNPQEVTETSQGFLSSAGMGLDRLGVGVDRWMTLALRRSLLKDALFQSLRCQMQLETRLPPTPARKPPRSRM